jgi:hypothetical protein
VTPRTTRKIGVVVGTQAVMPVAGHFNTHMMSTIRADNGILIQQDWIHTFRICVQSLSPSLMRGGNILFIGFITFGFIAKLASFIGFITNSLRLSVS